MQIDIAGEDARTPLLSDLATQTATPFRLIQGGVDHIQGEPVARFFLGLDVGERLSPALDFLKSRGAQIEVLGYVARPD